jgi:hypothetical protein
MGCAGGGSKGGTGTSADPSTGPDSGPPGDDDDDTGDDDTGDDDTGDGDGDVSPDAGTPEGCKTVCEADDCGSVSNGCGGVIECAPSCPEGQGCGFDPAKPSKCGFPPPVDCTPVDAAQACAGKCGSVPNGCSDVIACDVSNGGVVCSDSQLCGGYDGNRKPNECVELPACTPATCASLGFECGQTGDGCGATLDCTAEMGGCQGDQVCGTGANTGHCVEKPACKPKSRAEACAGKCGVVTDGCSATIDCEADASTRCPDGKTCGGGGVAGQCGSGQACQPKSAQEACTGKCGYQPDGCGQGYTCDASNGGQTCNANAGESCGGGGVANQCGAPACTPKSEAEACADHGGFKSCGKVGDGCGHLIDCGGCTDDQICGLGQANVCAQKPACMPTAVATACAGKCGTVPDGCGKSYDCSAQNGGITCTGQEFCGAVQPNKCGVPPSTCTPKTCAQLGHECGLASDGCGKVINCWPGCSPSDPNCTKTCPDAAQACLADEDTGEQTCVTGSASCVGPLCNSLPTCTAPAVTRLTGTLRTPGRQVSSAWVNQIPVPNAVVYIPADPNANLPDVFEGVSSSDPLSCSRCEDEKLVADGQTILAAAITDYKGEFTLEGRIPVGVPFELVIKIGRFRRVVQVPASTVKSCQSAALNADLTRLPKNKTDGLTGTHLPKMAISTGRVDEMECVLRGIGLDDAEFTVPSGNGRIHMYRANGARMQGTQCNGTYFAGIFDWFHSCAADNNYGCVTNQGGCSWNETTVPDTDLTGSDATINKYDMLVFDCEGQGIDRDLSMDARLAKYSRDGGRIFASHYTYYWLKDDTALKSSAVWGDSSFPDDGQGRVSLLPFRPNANAIKSVVFRNWLDWQGALTGTVPGKLTNPADNVFPIKEPRDHAHSVKTGADEWVHRNISNDTSVQQFSYNMPFDDIADNECGRVAYSGFHVAATDNGGENAFFPGVCSSGELTAQEKVLVFMLFDLSACVSAGDPPRPPECTPKTAAELCPHENDACGFLSDGCGKVVDCGGCENGYYCDGSTCRPQECTPVTCAQLGYNCGEHPDGCGHTARDAQGNEGCGVCRDGQTCGLGGPGLCGSVSCPPIPPEQACPANSCGEVSDGCGGTYVCGDCTSENVCGGAGPNICGPGSCSPISRDDACKGKNCGLASDGCGKTYDCGECMLPDTCGGAGQANVCGHPSCIPYTMTDACNGKECGWVSDGCGGAIHCGECEEGRICGGGGPNLCGAKCTPTDCSTENAQCGAIADGCGGVLDCGPCPVGETCGAGGPNVCAGGMCTPTNCAAADAECGLIGDGCGKVVDCGPCTAPGETCGGAGVPNECGTGTGGCKAITCDSQGVQCGAASDGCGGVLDCGGCMQGSVCEQGKCNVIPVVK